MEISEIISSYLNVDTNILEISFRLLEDNEDVVRNDNIDCSIAKDYGYNLITDNYDIFNEMFDEEEDDENVIEIDDEELIQFLNEYYVVNPKLLPKPELY